jgi:hypothetical protein
MEASGCLVAPAVFKTDVAGSAGQAGSIPDRLRDSWRERARHRACLTSVQSADTEGHRVLGHHA